MKKLSLSIALSSLLLLGACNSDDKEPTASGSANDGEEVSQYGTIDHGIDETGVGFSLSGETVEEAANVPADVKEQLVKAFTVYIDTLNEKDIDGYLATLSEDKYDLAEEREHTAGIFDEADVFREVSNITIVKYADKEAQLFTELQTTYKQLSSGLETKQTGRQVTVLTKDDGEWKVASVYYIGDDQEKK